MNPDRGTVHYLRGQYNRDDTPQHIAAYRVELFAIQIET